MTNEQYYDLIVPYQDALNLLKARLDVLNHSMYGNKSHPIHNIQFRIKQKASIEEKLKRMDLQGSFMNAKEHLQDIAGIRVICYFEKDVELLAEQLRKQSDLILVKEKDYITNPKPNGYRSFHMILGFRYIRWKVQNIIRWKCRFVPLAWISGQAWSIESVINRSVIIKKKFKENCFVMQRF